MKKTSYLNGYWEYLFIGILFILLSTLSLNIPNYNFRYISIYFGITIILKGCLELFTRRNLHVSKELIWVIVMGIIDISLGLFLISKIALNMKFIFSVWFILDSIGELFTIRIMKEQKQYLFWFSLMTSILGIILGLLLAFNPMVSSLYLFYLVGTYFMLNGFNYILRAL